MPELPDPSKPRLLPALAVAALLAFTLAGCADDGEGDPRDYADYGFDGSDTTGKDPDKWPDLEGSLVILDHGAFGGFGSAAKQFEALTGVKVEHQGALDAGQALQIATDNKGDPVHDVLYGVDNLLLGEAIERGVFEPYKPMLASRVEPRFVFFADGLEAGAAWPATPVDHGFIALNWDPRHEELEGGVQTLDDAMEHADLFVTQDPRISTPGLGFLLATIATYGEDDGFDWRDYWLNLFGRGVLVVPDWTTAYENHFTAGYGSEDGESDRPIVTSYSTSPAYEALFGRPMEDLAQVTLAPSSTWHQIQTMGILAGAGHRAAAQAWVEFTLTDAFQELAAPENAVYPVVPGISTTATFSDIDPDPGAIEPAPIGYEAIHANLERWLSEWQDLYEDAAAA